MFALHTLNRHCPFEVAEEVSDSSESLLQVRRHVWT